MKRSIAKKYKIQLFYLTCNHFSARIDDEKKKIILCAAIVQKNCI